MHFEFQTKHTPNGAHAKHTMRTHTRCLAQAGNHLPLPHVGWSMHVPLAVSLAPERYCLLVHVGWGSHVYPLVVPLQEPLRYAPLLQSMLLHWLQLKSLDVPSQMPLWYCPCEHSVLEHGTHVPCVVVLAPVRYWLAEHFG